MPGLTLIRNSRVGVSPKQSLALSDLLAKEANGRTTSLSLRSETKKQFQSLPLMLHSKTGNTLFLALTPGCGHTLMGSPMPETS